MDLEQEKLDKVYDEFLKLADRKKDINDDDVLMLVGKDRTATHRIKLEYLQVTSGVGVQSVASICLNLSGVRRYEAAAGNGPVDAGIKAVKKAISNSDMTIQEFLIQAINKGSDDTGKVPVSYTHLIRAGQQGGKVWRLLL